MQYFFLIKKKTHTQKKKNPDSFGYRERQDHSWFI